jgi:hypothetical protein
MLKFFWVIIVFFCLAFTGGIFISCQKEAQCDCEADTSYVATIFQPDGAHVKDAIIQNTLPNENFGSSSLFTVFSWTSAGFFETARAFLEFDLSSFSHMPKIRKATLTLYWNSYENLVEHTGENAFSIYRITQEWNEDSINWNNQPAVSELHKVTVGKSKSANQKYNEIDITELIQDIIDYPSVSHGLMFKLDEETPYKLVVLASSECNEQSKRPKLIIYY